MRLKQALSFAVLSIILLLINPLSTHAQTSTRGQRFWLGLIENISLLFNGVPAFGLVVSADQNTNGNIIVPQTGLIIPFTINAGETSELFLPAAVWYTQGSEIIDNKGILIETDQDITLQVYHYRTFFSESSVILPETMLSDEYLVLAGKDLNQNSASSLVIVATEDNTTIEIIPSALTQGLHAPGLPFTITMNEGQNYQIHASTDLSGSSVKALDGKNIAVFSGAKQADIWCQGDDSHLWEQLPPISAWRKEFGLLPYNGQGGDVVRVFAAFDSTVVKRNCNDWHVLDKGDWIEELITDPSYIQANHPILIAQFNKSQSCNTSDIGGPSFSFLNPIQYRQNSAQFICPFAEINPSDFDIHRITIICEANESNGIFIDNNEITEFQYFGPSESLAYTQIDLNSGNHELLSTYPVWTHFHGFGLYDGYAHSGHYTEETPSALTVEINAEGNPISKEYCIDEAINFEYLFDYELANWNWDFGDGSSSNLTNPNHLYSNTGLYSINMTGTDINGCSFNGNLAIEIEDCSIYIDEFTYNNSFYIDSNGMLNSKIEGIKSNMNAYDSSGRLLKNAINIDFPIELPKNTFLIQLIDEESKITNIKIIKN